MFLGNIISKITLLIIRFFSLIIYLGIHIENHKLVYIYYNHKLIIISIDHF